MKTGTCGLIGWMAASLLAGAALLLTNGCNSTTTSPPAATSAQISGTPGEGQPLFASDDEALNDACGRQCPGP